MMDRGPECLYEWSGERKAEQSWTTASPGWSFHTGCRRTENQETRLIQAGNGKKLIFKSCKISE